MGKKTGQKKQNIYFVGDICLSFEIYAQTKATEHTVFV